MNSKIQTPSRVPTRGGARPRAGRKPGQATRMNEEARAKALESGISPLDYMLARLRDETCTPDARMDAAKAAAPYVHAKLAAVEHSGDLPGPLSVMFSTVYEERKPVLK